MVNSNDVKIAVIGGSGLYNLEGLEVIEEVNPETVSIYQREKQGNRDLKKKKIALGIRQWQNRYLQTSQR